MAESLENASLGGRRGLTFWYLQNTYGRARVFY